MGNLFEEIPADLPEELFHTLGAARGVRIERIVSRGHASPPGFWYDQPGDEFVLVVRGRAGLRIEGKEGIVVLETGDYLTLGAGVKHRVEWTDEAGDTIWLAVHY